MSDLEMYSDEVKIIFQDVDGCLNPEDGEDFGVSNSWEPSANQVRMFEALDAALETSSVEHFVINTGRSWPHARFISNHIRSNKLRYFLVEHACVLYDREADRFIDCAALAADLGLGGLAKRYQNLEAIELLMDWYQTTGRAQLEAHYGVDLEPVDKRGNLSFAVPDGCDGGDVLEHVETLAREQFDGAQLDEVDFLRSDRYIDILPGVHKLDGIHLVSGHLNVELSQAVAVGDYLNDLSVFESFDRVLCPSNAHPQIKELTLSKGVSGKVSDKPYGAALLELLCEL